MWRTSDMFHAITRSSAASDAIGTYGTMCGRSRIEATTTAACTTAASGERAPARMLVAVRARAPVAAMPPKNGAAMLARPWPTSSASGSWRFPVIPSAMTAERSDSIAPSIAIANAAGSSFSTSRNVSGVSPHGRRGSGDDRGGAAGGGGRPGRGEHRAGTRGGGGGQRDTTAPGEGAGGEQPGGAEARHDGRENDEEGRCRPGHLDLRPAGERRHRA